jgi:hypothetical protein
MRLQVKFLAIGLLTIAACTPSTSSSPGGGPAPSGGAMSLTTNPPSPDPRVGLRGGLMDAGEATWNLRVVSKTPPAPNFLGVTNSDLAFKGNYAIQGNYNGYQVWDISNPAKPTLKTAYLCPASQSDVSVYKNLLFVSSESNSGRLDCGTGGVKDPVSKERIRGIRIFDATDISNPKYLTNVQTCRGSHTHTVVTQPNDPDNVYVYISGQAGVRPAAEMPGCVDVDPEKDANSAHFRIEVIKVPLAHPEQAAIVTSPRIFDNLAAPASHGEAPEDKAAQEAMIANAKKNGGFVASYTFTIGEKPQEIVLGPGFTRPLLDSIVKARNGTGAPTAADTAALRAAIPAILTARIGPPRKATGPDQCHDITVYPAIGMAGGACAGYGLLLDIRDVAHPKRLGAVADSNFSYWHSATFNNDGTKLLFSDEWGGGGAPKCRATDKPEWGADALFDIVNGKMVFRSYYKMLAPQTKFENCVAHNGSLIPIPGRDVMVQAWYQGGISVFDWTDTAHPKEIAYFDRGPVDSTKFAMGGSWSAYWYNGVIVSSEIARGLDILELTPNALITQNEIDAAKTVRFDELNVQDQPKLVWPPSFALARAYLDQLERNNGLDRGKISSARSALSGAESKSGEDRREALKKLASQLSNDASGAGDRAKVQKVASAVTDLAK